MEQMTIAAIAPPDKVSSSKDGTLVGAEVDLVDGAAVMGNQVGVDDTELPE